MLRVLQLNVAGIRDTAPTVAAHQLSGVPALCVIKDKCREWGKKRKREIENILL